LARAFAALSPRRGQLQMSVAAVVGVGAHLLGQLVEALHVVGHPVLGAVLARGVLGQEAGERRGREAGGPPVGVAGVPGECPL
jgi:hypothetical protein